MAFGDTFRATTWTGEDLADSLEDLLVEYNSLELTSTINTTSTSLVDYTSGSVTVTAETGDILLCTASMSCGHSATGGQSTLAINVNSSDSQEVYALSYTTNANGTTNCIAHSYIAAATSGTNTIKLRWRTNTGTVYSARAFLTVVVLRNT